MACVICLAAEVVKRYKVSVAYYSTVVWYVHHSEAGMKGRFAGTEQQLEAVHTAEVGFDSLLGTQDVEVHFAVDIGHMDENGTLDCHIAY